MSGLHLVHQYFDVTQRDRSRLKEHKPLVIWFCGLSGSGKSTLANALTSALHERRIHTYSLDGDNVRLGLNRDLGFSEADRIENLRRIGEVAKLMADAGLVVTTSFITPLEASRKQLRAIFPPGQYFEVFVDCPLEICEQRDVKGLYAKARAGLIPEFTGVSAPFEPPAAPDAVADTARQTIDACIDSLLQQVLPHIFF